MDIANQLITIFCEIDDFCKEFNQHAQSYLLDGPAKGKRGPACTLSTSKIMTILVLFQMIRFRDFETFYKSFYQFISEPTFDQYFSHQTKTLNFLF